MDNRKFDDLTRSMAIGKSRRTVIKGLFGGVVGTIAVAGRPAYGALAGEPVACTAELPCLQGICCAGTCRDIECCIDNPDPNATCPEGTSCFEGYCDPIILGCGNDDECAGDEICCEGVCAAIQCCIGDTDPNARCPEGTSCFEGYCDTFCDAVGCPDGECCCDTECSAACCETPISVLPATGSGTDSEGGAWIAAAAIGGAAAYVTARKVRTPETQSTGE